MALTKVSRGLLSTSIVDNGNATAITIDSSENVGIGTSSPSASLHTTGDAIIGTTTHGASYEGVLQIADGAVNGRTAVLIYNNHPDQFMKLGQDANTTFIGRDNADEFAIGLFDNASDTTLDKQFVIDSSGKVGIGTSSPSALLDVSANGSSIMRLSDSSSPATYAEFKQANGVLSFNADAGNAQSSTVMKFLVDNSERMRIDGSSGNLLVGTTTSIPAGSSQNVVGVAIQGGDGEIQASSEAVALYANRKDTDGNIAVFRRDGTDVGSIGTTSSTMWIAGNTANSSGVRFYTYGTVACDGSGAYTDNTKDLGSPSVRWDDIYATNGTIQTSDRNEKQDIAELSDAEQRVAVACKGLLRKFRWKDSVAEKGDDARIHFGIIAQDLQAAFEAEGLDAGDYAMFISTTWTDEETNEEKTRMGVRYSELLAFIISAI